MGVDKWGHGRFDDGPFREDLLAEWINTLGCTRVAELGVFDGYTMRTILEKCDKLEELVGIDTWAHPETFSCLAPKGERSRLVYEECDHDANYKLTMKNIEESGNTQPANVLKMTTCEAAQLYEDGYFDLIFIDADHSYEGVKKDIETWYSKVKKGGVVAGHDFSWAGVQRAIAETVGLPNVKQFTDDVWLHQKGFV
tara:strand:- start:16 stop:606 length:591 start_codon:yes stop_codon:yes gene_type:complete